MNRRFGYVHLLVALIIGLVLGIAATRFLTPQHHRDRETFEECLVHASIGSATFVGCAASRSIGFASIARLVDDRRSRMASRHWRDKILLTVL
jgi:hypothetical protein